MNKKLLFGLGVIVIAVILTLALGNRKDATRTPAQEPVRIGMSVCQTGSCAEWGENAIKGAKLAVKANNADTKNVPLELVIEDSREDQVQEAIAGYQKLRSQGIEFFLTPTWTPASQALGPIIAKDPVVAIGHSVGVRDYNEAGENIFNTWPHDDEGTRYLARFVKAQGINKVAIVSSKQPWEQLQGNAFEDEFKKQGGTITSKIEPLLAEKDFKTYAIDIVKQQADAVFYSNLSNMGIGAKDLKNAGFTGKQFAVLMDQTRLDQANGALDGTLYVQSPEADPSFVAEFTSEYGKKPGVSADNAYDAIMWLSKALNATNDHSPKNIASLMRRMTSLEGTANGTLTFDGKGAVVRDPALWVVENGIMKKYQ